MTDPAKAAAVPRTPSIPNPKIGTTHGKYGFQKENAVCDSIPDDVRLVSFRAATSGGCPLPFVQISLRSPPYFS
ncbi:MAG: hypothetical protein AAF570_08400, partial [Bacteroidota bacterium]